MSQPADLSPKINAKEEGKQNALVVHFKELDKKAESWIQSWNPYHPDLIKKRSFQPVAIEESRIKRHATRLFIGAFLIFMVWAFTAPIDAGVTSTGTVMVSGYRQQLQHPTGGVIQEILVKEGDTVQAGDILIRINPLKAEAELSSAQLQYINALVTEARLYAERSGSSRIIWPPELGPWAKEPKVEDAKQIQQTLFNTRRTEYAQVLASRRTQLATLSEESIANAQLAKEGFVSRSQSNQVLRMKLEAEQSLNTMQASYFKEIDTQLAQIQATRDAMKDRFQAVTFDRDLTSIRAPVSGIVMALKVNTVGGTFPKDQVLAEIVPAEAKLVVDAKVPTDKIDRVKLGQIVDIRFTAFNADTTPVIAGKVILLGVDKQPAAQGSSEEFYLAKVEATPEGLDKLGNLVIQPGMSVDVLMKTGERTFMSYLLKPLTDKFALAFK
jgi:protease secretion system membrane fusion protein